MVTKKGEFGIKIYVLMYDEPNALCKIKIRGLLISITKKWPPKSTMIGCVDEYNEVYLYVLSVYMYVYVACQLVLGPYVCA